MRKFLLMVLAILSTGCGGVSIQTTSSAEFLRALDTRPRVSIVAKISPALADSGVLSNEWGVIPRGKIIPPGMSSIALSEAPQYCPQQSYTRNAGYRQRGEQCFSVGQSVNLFVTWYKDGKPVGVSTSMVRIWGGQQNNQAVQPWIITSIN